MCVDTSTENIDYVGRPAGHTASVVTIPAGQTYGKCLIAIKDDEAVEPNETLSVTIATVADTPPTASLGSLVTARVTILADGGTCPRQIDCGKASYPNRLVIANQC